MTPADRAIVAAAEERDREWPKDYGQWPRFVRADVQPSWDRRELLRIVREQEAALKGVVAANYVDEPLAGENRTWPSRDDFRRMSAAEVNRYLESLGLRNRVFALPIGDTDPAGSVDIPSAPGGTQAGDAADDAAAERATSGKWGGL